MINGENLASSVVSGDYRLTHGLCINLVAFVWGFGCGLHWLYHCRVQCCVRRWQQGPEQWWIFILRVCPGFPGRGPEQPAVAAALALLSSGSEQRPPPRGLCSLPSTPPPVWPCLYVMMGPTNATVIDLYHHPSSITLPPSIPPSRLIEPGPQLISDPTCKELQADELHHIVSLLTVC